MKKLTFTLCLATCSPVAFTQAGEWPEFRGPLANGIAENATPPLEWGPNKNVVWRRELPGAGWSSPVVYQGSVYLTTATTDDEGNPNSLRVLRVDAATGDILWDAEAISWSGKARSHKKG